MSRISILKRSISTAAAAVRLCRPAFAGKCESVRCQRLPRSADQRDCKEPVARADLAPALACSGRPSATAPGRRPPIGGRVGLGAPATAARPGAEPQADHLSRVLTQRAAIIPGGNNL